MAREPASSSRRLITLRGLLARLALLIVGAAGVGWFTSVAEDPHWFHHTSMFVGGACLLGGAFLIGQWLLLIVLSPKLSVFGVARTVLTEAMRMNLSIAFLTALALILAMLPLVVSGDDPLEYRIQQFLGYTLGLRLFPPSPMLLLSMLTVLLSCWTLSHEVEHKQVFTVLTKPINRGAYLFGKWLGIVLLNALLVGVVGLAVYGFVTLYMVNLPAKDALDRQNVKDKVLTARMGANPVPPGQVLNRIDEQMQRLIDERGEAYLAERGGEAQVRDEIRKQVLTEWRSLGPFGRSHYREIYLFTGLDNVEQYGDTVQLEYKFRASGARQEQRVWFWAGGRPLSREPQQVALNIRQTLLVPASRIEDGRLEVGVINYDPQRSITFVDEQGLRLMYRVDDFTSNFARAVAMIWIKLAFLAALGLAMASFLGFPVAALASMLIFFVAWASGFLAEALTYFGGADENILVKLLKVVGWAFTFLLRQYSRYEPATLLVEGRYIAWTALGGCALWIGVVWTGLAGVVGWLIFRGRELARVQV